MTDTTVKAGEALVALGTLCATVFIFLGSIFFFVIFNTFLGALAGWIVGLVFGETILNILGQLGVHNVTMWQFGAFMGFVGGFLKTRTTIPKGKKDT